MTTTNMYVLLGYVHSYRTMEQAVQFASHAVWNGFFYPVHVFLTPDEYDYVDSTSELILSDMFKRSVEKYQFVHINSLDDMFLTIFPKEGIGARNRFQFHFHPTEFVTGHLTYENLISVIQASIATFGVEECRTMIKGFKRKGYGVRLPSVKHPLGDLHNLQPSWITFYGNRLIEFMGEDRFDALTDYHELIRLPEGIILSLQKELFDSANPEHIARVDNAIRDMNLNEFKNGRY